jgi:endonuclease/exonuclease/phosphatase family metal-dependent hydrolase
MNKKTLTDMPCISLFKILAISIAMLLLSKAQAADTLRVMHYNLLYYDRNTSFCTPSNNNVDAKDVHLNPIISYYNPDIFTVNELNSSLSSADRVLNNVLNENGRNDYRRANFSGDNIVNMLYYNTEKLGLKSQTYILTSPRITDVYTLYHKNEGLARGDTLFLTCIVTHLKAGASDTQARGEAALQVMNFIGHRNISGNVLFMGDLNLYTSSEPAFQTLTSPASNGLFFSDPVNAIGDWQDNPEFAMYHTQSTRTSGGCFAGGGMDDRFDFILASPDVLSSGGIEYINGTYWALGQDGQRLNESLIDPVNTSLPADVLNALYNMSDHLPVTLKLLATYSPAVSNAYYHKHSMGVITRGIAGTHMEISVPHARSQYLRVELFNSLGALVSQTNNWFNEGEWIYIPSKALHSGLYIIRVNGEDFIVSEKIVRF